MPEAREQNRAADTIEKQKAIKERQGIGLRWLTAVIAVPIVLLAAWFGGWVGFAFLVLVAVLGTLELHTMMLHAGYHPLLWMSCGLSVLFLIAAMLPQERLLIIEIGLGGALLISFPWLFLRQKLEGSLIDWALTLAFSIYLGWPLSFFLLMRGSVPVMIHPGGMPWLILPRDLWWLLFTLTGVWGFDIAAFFAGRQFGRHKLAPKISPGKTWEGALGGFVFAIIVALLFTIGPLGLAWYLAILLGFLLGVAALLGDLAESLIKRQVHVKDSGQIMPGHGGLLDRTDSLLFAVIVIYVAQQLIGR